jgi:hypothetical protein
VKAGKAGTSVPAAPPIAQVLDDMEALEACRHCGQLTMLPTGDAFCQHCAVELKAGR